MIEIVLVGSTGAKKLLGLLGDVLGRERCVGLVDDKRIYRSSGKLAYLLYHIGSTEFVSTPSSIVILLDDYQAGRTVALGPETVVLFNSQFPDSVKMAAQAKAATISCGLQTTDTLTLSSNTVDSAVVSLQRTLTTFTGEVIEPTEYPVTLSRSLDAFSILVLAAIMLLGGHQNELNGLVL